MGLLRKLQVYRTPYVTKPTGNAHKQTQAVESPVHNVTNQLCIVQWEELWSEAATVVV